MQPAISRVDTEDAFDAVIDTLVLSFATDPVSRWMHGGTAGAQLRDFPRIMRALGRDCLAAGTMFRTADGAGVALWMPPGAPSNDDALASAFGQAVPAHRQAEAHELLDWTDRHAPPEPFWYLSLIGVDPARRGHGIGATLLADGLRHVDADGVPAYLWSSNPRNVPLYRRHGFEVVAEARFGSSPVVTAMRRNAHGAGNPAAG